MQIIKVEVPSEYGVGVCENCLQEKPARRVEAFGMVRESRGWYILCFDCFGPQMWWRENSGGKVWMSPASNMRLQADASPRESQKDSIQGLRR